MLIDLNMAVNRYCLQCMEEGEFSPLRFVMMNINTGIWICSKDECVFPMNSIRLKDYLEENLSTEQVLTLMRKGCKSSKLQSLSALQLANLPLPSKNSSKQTSSCSNSKGSDQLSKTSSRHSHSVVDHLSSHSSSSTIDKHDATFLYPLWENEGLLCWLDAVLAMIVLNETFTQCCLSQDQAFNAFTGGLFLEYKYILTQFNMHKKYSEVKNQLNDLRNNFLLFLQPKLLSNCGEEESLLFSLSLIFKTNKLLNDSIEVDYQCVFKCEECAFTKQDGFRKTIVSVPNCTEDLRFPENITFRRPCYKCFKDNQKAKITFERYPNVLIMHFNNGVRSPTYWDALNFETDGEKFVITKIIQYVSRKKHFVSWSYNYQDLCDPFFETIASPRDLFQVRDFERQGFLLRAPILTSLQSYRSSVSKGQEKLWLQADDLKDPVQYYKYKRPKCSPREVHMLLWERVSYLSTLKRRSAPQLPIDISDVQQVAKSFKSSPTSSCASTSTSLDELWDSKKTSRAASLKSSESSPLPSPQVALKNSVKMQCIPRYKPYISKSKAKELQKVRDKSDTSDIGETSLLSTNTVAPKGSITPNESGADDSQAVLEQLQTILSEELTECYNDLLVNTETAPTLNDPPGTYASAVLANDDSRPIAEFLPSSSTQGTNNVNNNGLINSAIPAHGADVLLPDIDFTTQEAVFCSDGEFSLDDILNGT